MEVSTSPLDVTESPAGQQLRALAGSLDNLSDNLPPMVRMVMPEVDTEGAAAVLESAAQELDRLAALDHWASRTELLLQQLTARLEMLEGGDRGE